MIRLRTVGESLIEAGDSRIGPDSEVLFGLLLVLAWERGRPVSRKRVIELLWPASTERLGGHCLRQLLYRTRQMGISVHAHNGSLMLGRETVDADYLSLMEESPAPEVAAVREGGFLPGYAPDFSEPFSEWVEECRGVVHAQLLRKSLAQLASLRRVADWRGVEALARRCLGIDAFNEEATLALAESMAARGSKTQAVATLDQYLADLGDTGRDLKVQANVLRRRIAERLPDIEYLRSGEAPFVGRSEDMAVLDGMLQSALHGHSASTLVWGPAGIGKSRLVEEFGTLAVLQGVRVVRATCQPADERRPLSAFAALVPQLSTLPGGLGISPSSLAYLRRITARDPMSGAPTPESADSEVLAANIRHAVLDLVDAVTSEIALLIVIEDTHRMDRSSWHLIRELLSWAGCRRLCLVLTSRVERPLTSDAVAEGELPIPRRKLPPLTVDGSTALLESLLPHLPQKPEADVQRRWVDLSEGNPFHLRELVRHSVQRSDPYAVPLPLRALIDRRLKQLPPRALRLLQSCAVLGRHATMDRVQRLLEYRQYVLLDSFDRLGESGLVVYEGSLVRCRHELITDAVLEGINLVTRRTLHRLAGELLQAELKITDDMKLLWDCAHHWQEAGEAQRAVSLVQACARHFIELGHPNDAAELLERVVELCGNAADTDSVLDDLGYALRAAGRWQALTEVIPRKRATGASARNGSQKADDELMLIEAEWRSRCDPVATMPRALACLRDARIDVPRRLDAGVLAMMVADSQCDRVASSEILQECEPLLASGQAGRRTCLLLPMMFHTTFGDAEKATALAADLIAHEREMDAPPALIRALRFSSYPLRITGRFREAEENLREALALAERYQSLDGALASITLLAHVRAELDDMDGAATWHARGKPMLANTENTPAAFDYRLMGIRIEVAQDAPEPRDHSGTIRWDEITGNRTVRARSYGLGVLIRAATRSGTVKAESRYLRMLESSFAISRTCTKQDYAAYTLFLAYRADRREREATDFLSDYVSLHRHERSRLPREISEALSRSEMIR